MEHAKLSSGARREVAIVKSAVAEAIETHRRLGQSIVVWRDGKPTWIAPEDIPPLETNSSIVNRKS
jgi:hypothetical protein